MTLLQLLSLGGSLAFLLMVLFALHRAYLREGYALLWIAVTCGMIVLSLIPRSMDKLARIIGIHIAPFVLVLFMLAGMSLMLFQQSVVISRHNEKIKRLAEELALLKARCKDSDDERA